MNKKTLAMAAMAAALTPAAFANTTLLVNPDFSNGTTGWMGGSNIFKPTATWLAYVTDAWTVADRVTPSGNGFVMTSWDDEDSDKIETYVIQEFGAGPVGSPTETVFNTGDVIRFRGKASATRSGTDTSDMIVRAFIKTLGYNSQGWEFQTKPEYSDFFPLTSELQAFDLTVTYPDLAVDDSLQVIQLGFEITTLWDGAAMDSGTIYFEDLEGFIEGQGGDTWAGFPVNELGVADTGAWLGPVNVQAAPFIYVENLGIWGYSEESYIGPGGGWVFFFGNIPGGSGENLWAGFTVNELGVADTGAWLGPVNVQVAPFIYIATIPVWGWADESTFTAGGGWVYVYL
jgi:hypothetical protein